MLSLVEVRAVQRFIGRNVIVTGAARGIGRAITLAFVGEGAHVVALDRDRRGLEALERSIGASDQLVSEVVDLADIVASRAAMSRILAGLGRLDVLVNNAALQPATPILDVDDVEWAQTFEVNLHAPFVLSQEAARSMIVGGGGSIVNIASANAIRNESPEGPYNASKAALLALTRAFAHELGHLGIRVNAVAPGETVSDEDLESLDGEALRLEREYLWRIPMRRVGRPEEQAAAVLFLASDDSSFINGATLVVDGGELAGEWLDLAARPPLPDRLVDGDARRG